MTKWKISGLCAVAGASFLMSMAWHIEDKLFWWAWVIIAMLCMCVVGMIDVHGCGDAAGRIYKAKIGVPSALLGADAVMMVVAIYGVWSAHYYGGDYYLLERAWMLLAWGVIAALLVIIVHMVKPPTAAKT